MLNILDYFNSLMSYFFGSSLSLQNPVYMMSRLNSIVDASLSSSSPFEYFLLTLFQNTSVVFSFVVWFWFAWLTLHLLLIWPFKWIRSVVTRK